MVPPSPNQPGMDALSLNFTMPLPAGDHSNGSYRGQKQAFDPVRPPNLSLSRPAGNTGYGDSQSYTASYKRTRLLVIVRSSSKLETRGYDQSYFVSPRLQHQPTIPLLKLVLGARFSLSIVRVQVDGRLFLVMVRFIAIKSSGQVSWKKQKVPSSTKYPTWVTTDGVSGTSTRAHIERIRSFTAPPC